MPEETATSNAWWDDGGVLLHIGPHKTGTTALQHSLAAARSQLAEQAIIYPGKGANHYRATRERIDGAQERWQQLISEIQATGQPAIISSEFLDRVDSQLAPQIIAELGGRVRILITLRPLATIIPSLWQQHVKCGTAADLAPWTSDLFRRGPEHVSWRSVDHLGLIRQWQEIVGDDRVVILIGDLRDPARLLRGFEGLAGINAGTLQLSGRSNRSMTVPESELALALNRRAADLGITAQQQIHWVRRGIYARTIEERQVMSDEPKLVLPASVRSDVDAQQRQVVDLLCSSGSRVVGDPESLLTGTSNAQQSGSELAIGAEELIPVDVAAGMLAALLEKSLAREQEQQRKIARLRRKVEKQKQSQGSQRQHSRWPWRR